MKGPLVAALVVVLLAGAGGAYLLLHSPSTSSGSSSTTSTQSTSSTSSPIAQIQSSPADVTVNLVMCVSAQGTCVVTLENSGGTTVGATSCTLNGLSAVLAPSPGGVPAGGIVNVSCSPSSGTALSIPGFHVQGSIQFSDDSSVQFTGTWK